MNNTTEHNVTIKTEISKELHKQLKMYCAGEQISIKQFLSDLLSEFFGGDADELK